MPVIAKQFCCAKPKGSSVNFTSKQILPFGFSWQNCEPCALNSLDHFHDTMCVQAHLIEAFITVAAKCWRHWPKILPSLRLLQVIKLACFAT